MIPITRRQLLGILLASVVLLSAQAPVVGQDTPQALLKVGQHEQGSDSAAVVLRGPEPEAT